VDWDVVFEVVMRSRVNSVVAVEANQVANDASGEDQSQTSNGKNKWIEEDWIEPEEADTAKAGDKEKHGACDETSLNQVDDQSGRVESDGGDLGTDSRE
jgi:hypothetical protein